MKLISGYVENSDCRFWVFRRGNVLRNAFANKEAICDWDIDTLCDLWRTSKTGG